MRESSQAEHEENASQLADLADVDVAAGRIIVEELPEREHGLILIPRRVLALVLSDPRNTSDGIHLTQRGHDRMAEELAPGSV